MINLTRLWTGLAQPGDHLRYGQRQAGHGHGHTPKSAGERKPVVVWNLTRTCNLFCQHCYAGSDRKRYPGELHNEQLLNVMDDLATYGVPALLLSGGEPTLHPDFFNLAEQAVNRGLSLTLSTNGTRLNEERAAKLAQIGFRYIGISLDGIGETHDHFRGRKGAFDATVQGIRNCRAAGLKVGLRLTLTRVTASDLDRLLDFAEIEDIQRLCFYHLIPVGRGVEDLILQPEETRAAIRVLLDRIDRWHKTGQDREVLTVAQPADGAFLLHEMAAHRPERLREAESLLRWNGGGKNGPGTGIGCIDPQGDVYTDQFRRSDPLGNVKTEPFSVIWERHRAYNFPIATRLNRCADCAMTGYCGSGFRRPGSREHLLRPACYLTEKEISQLPVALQS